MSCGGTPRPESGAASLDRPLAGSVEEQRVFPINVVRHELEHMSQQVSQRVAVPACSPGAGFRERLIQFQNAGFGMSMFV
jgi:hypothetical protein